MHAAIIDATRKSWVHVPEGSDFPLQNLPLGIFRPGNGLARAGMALGDQVIDLNALHTSGFLAALNLPDGIFAQPVLNDFLAMGRTAWRGLRNRVADLFDAANPELQGVPDKDSYLFPLGEVQLQMPVFVRDYTDFYSSEGHATNVGTMFRGKENALMPNWKHLPVGYHGRASSIVVSSQEVRRPKGQLKPDDSSPIYGPSRLLDFELEMAFVIGEGTSMGKQISTSEAEAHIAGMLIFNDWSARDIQKWEYVPLGPFLGKSFASSVSPWLVSLDALEPFRVAGPVQDPPVLPYLEYEGDAHYDIQLEVLLEIPGQEPVTICRSNHRNLYWNMIQQLAHHTVNGCNLNPGDLMASGTISGTTPDSFGSMLELSWRGTKPLPMPDGSERKFIQDGDTVIMRAWAEKDGLRIGFGEVRSTVLPAN
ncbi:MAG: fumarylacetoacetase [Bacteroidota bacterium]